jgi:hypothetical protein
VNTVMNLRVPYNAGKPLSRCTISSIIKEGRLTDEVIRLVGEGKARRGYRSDEDRCPVRARRTAFNGVKAWMTHIGIEQWQGSPVLHVAVPLPEVF